MVLQWLLLEMLDKSALKDWLLGLIMGILYGMIIMLHGLMICIVYNSIPLEIVYRVQQGSLYGIDDVLYSEIVVLPIPRLVCARLAPKDICYGWDSAD